MKTHADRFRALVRDSSVPQMPAACLSDCLVRKLHHRGYGDAGESVTVASKGTEASMDAPASMALVVPLEREQAPVSGARTVRSTSHHQPGRPGIEGVLRVFGALWMRRHD
jgi:hypothetical protein